MPDKAWKNRERLVARFFGGVNFLKSTINNNKIETEIGPINYQQKNRNELSSNHLLTIRPENIEISKTNTYKENYFSGIVTSIIFSGTKFHGKFSSIPSSCAICSSNSFAPTLSLEPSSEMTCVFCPSKSKGAT